MKQALDKSNHQYGKQPHLGGRSPVVGERGKAVQAVVRLTSTANGAQEDAGEPHPWPCASKGSEPKRTLGCGGKAPAPLRGYLRFLRPQRLTLVRAGAERRGDLSEWEHHRCP